MLVLYAYQTIGLSTSYWILKSITNLLL